MGIKLTTEVKEVIHQMIAITKEFELGMMNTLVLFDALLLNRLFATSMEVSSSCKLELISDDVQRILRNGHCDDAKEDVNKTEKNGTDAVFSSEHETKTTEGFIEVKHTKKRKFISLPRALLMHVEQIVEVLIFHRIWQMFLPMQFRL